MREFDVLLVDDSPVFRDSLKDLLVRHFPEMMVDEAANCSDAWRKLNTNCPQLIFSDISLQDEDGFAFINQVRQFYPDVVLAVITGHDGLEYREAAYANGADCYVPKNTATTADILCLVESIHSGKLPLWTLGADYINPAPPARPWK